MVSVVLRGGSGTISPPVVHSKHFGGLLTRVRLETRDSISLLLTMPLSASASR